MSYAISLSKLAQVGLTCAAFALAGCSAATDGEVEGTSHQGVSAEPTVRLVYAATEYAGCSSCFSTRGVIEVANLGYEKQVDLVYTTGGGVWSTYPTTYRASPTGSRDLFAFEDLRGVQFQFAVRYRVSGHEYWDNNGGANYQVGLADGSADIRSALGSGRDVAVTRARECAGAQSLDAVCIDALVRNRAFQKSVRVVYTTDGWRTTKTGTFGFQSTSPSSVEKWSATISGLSAANELTFAVVEEQGGTSQWDNAYGKNFSCTKRQSRSLQDWSCTGGGLAGR